MRCGKKINPPNPISYYALFGNFCPDCVSIISQKKTKKTEAEDRFKGEYLKRITELYGKKKATRVRKKMQNSKKVDLQVKI